VTEGVFPFAKSYQKGERPTRSAVCTSSVLHSLRPCWTDFLSIPLTNSGQRSGSIQRFSCPIAHSALQCAYGVHHNLDPVVSQVSG
jgi:hypothetical protein